MRCKNKLFLKNWGLVKVSGVDKFTFLQGQLTNDITNLRTEQILFSGHCDPKGKLIAFLILFIDEKDDAIYYLVRKSLQEKQIQALRKYSVFSKVTIEPVIASTVYGIVKNEATLDSLSTEKNIKIEDNTTLLRLTSNCEFLIEINSGLTDAELKQIQDDIFETSLLQDGFPIIDLPLSEQYLPQAFNLEIWNAINYKKGCYCGQEMVARAHYRGINKRLLYLLSSSIDNIDLACLPTIGSALHQKINDDYRDTGMISALVIDKKNQRILVQVILAFDFDFTQTLELIKNTTALQLLAISR